MSISCYNYIYYEQPSLVCLFPCLTFCFHFTFLWSCCFPLASMFCFSGLTTRPHTCSLHFALPWCPSASLKTVELASRRAIILGLLSLWHQIHYFWKCLWYSNLSHSLTGCKFQFHPAMWRQIAFSSSHCWHVSLYSAILYSVCNPHPKPIPEPQPLLTVSPTTTVLEFQDDKPWC